MSDATSALLPAPRLGDVVSHLARLLDTRRNEGALSPGDLAELRRMKPTTGDLPPALWRLLTSKDLTGVLVPKEDHERAFAVLIGTMAQPGVLGPNPLPIGRALAEANYSEQRFVRLLRANCLSDIAQEARLAVQWCASHGKHLLFGRAGGDDGFGGFIINAALSRATASRHAHAIARDFFRQDTREAHEETAAEPTP